MKLLVVVDMQNDFISGALGTPEAQAIVPNVASKVQKYKEDGEYIIYTADTHFDGYLNTQEGKNLPVPHCIHNTHGWQIADGVYVNNAPIVKKFTFGSQELPDRIYALEQYTDKHVESIEVVGLCTSICVISNALILKSCFPEIPLIVDSKCCACVSPETHNAALLAMKTCQIEVV